MIPTPKFTSIKHKTHPLEYPWKHFKIDLDINELDLLLTMLNGLHFMGTQNMESSKQILGNRELQGTLDKLQLLIENIDDQLT